MTLQNEGRPRAGFRQGAFGNALSLAAEHPELSADRQRDQAVTLARQYELASRRSATDARALPGTTALQLLALAGHYAQRAKALMTEATR